MSRSPTLLRYDDLLVVDAAFAELGVARLGGDAGVDIALEVGANRLVSRVLRDVELPRPVRVHRHLQPRALPRGCAGGWLLRRRRLPGLREI